MRKLSQYPPGFPPTASERLSYVSQTLLNHDEQARPPRLVMHIKKYATLPNIKNLT